MSVTIYICMYVCMYVCVCIFNIIVSWFLSSINMYQILSNIVVAPIEYLYPSDGAPSEPTSRSKKAVLLGCKASPFWWKWKTPNLRNQPFLELKFIYLDHQVHILLKNPKESLKSIYLSIYIYIRLYKSIHFLGYYQGSTDVAFFGLHFLSTNSGDQQTEPWNHVVFKGNHPLLWPQDSG